MKAWSKTVAWRYRGESSVINLNTYTILSTSNWYTNSHFLYCIQPSIDIKDMKVSGTNRPYHNCWQPLRRSDCLAVCFRTLVGEGWSEMMIYNDGWRPLVVSIDLRLARIVWVSNGNVRFDTLSWDMLHVDTGSQNGVRNKSIELPPLVTRVAEIITGQTLG